MMTPRLDRITTDPEILSGKPVIRGTRIPISLILNLLAHGYTPERVVAEYPILTAEDVRAALYYASVRFERAPAKRPVAAS
jgi:uncharacterized protein (DUF433 family)